MAKRKPISQEDKDMVLDLLLDLDDEVSSPDYAAEVHAADFVRRVAQIVALRRVWNAL